MRRPILTALLGLSLLVASAVQAATPKLTLAPRFGKALVPGYEQPVNVTLTNPAGAPAFTGEVSLGIGRQRWRTPVTLSAGPSVATVTLQVQVPRLANDTWVMLRGAQGELLTSTMAPLAVKPDTVLPVLVIRKDGTAGDWETLQNEGSGVRRAGGRLVPGAQRFPRQMGNSPASALENYYTVETATPSQLSERAGELAQFGIVVLSDDHQKALSDGQRGALLRWVSGGGILVRPDETTDQVEPLGAGRIVHAKGRPSVKTLVGSMSYTQVLRDAAQMTEPESDRTQAAAYLNGQAGLFPEVLKANTVQAPPFSTIVLFLGAYLIVVVPVQYILLRRHDKREWAWGTTPLLAGVFALGAYGVGSQGRSREAFYNTAAIIETGSGQTTGAAIARFGLYSPTRTTYSLTAPTPDTQFFGTEGDLSQLTTLQMPGQPTHLSEVAVPQWAMRSVSLYTHDLPLGGGVAVTLKHEGAFLVGKVTNNTGVPLQDVSVFATDAQRIATLAPGQSLTFRLAYNPTVGGVTSVWRFHTAPTVGDNNKHFFDTLDESLYDSSHPGEVLVFAHVAQELVPVKVEGATVAPKITDSLLIVHAPVPPRQ